jgi:hypothetical protein
MSENNGKFDSYLSDLKRIEGTIQILGQFDNNAYNIFHAECSEIRKNVMDLQNKIGVGIGTAECNKVINKIADLEHKFEKYLDNIYNFLHVLSFFYSFSKNMTIGCILSYNYVNYKILPIKIFICPLGKKLTSGTDLFEKNWADTISALKLFIYYHFFIYKV